MIFDFNFVFVLNWAFQGEIGEAADGRYAGQQLIFLLLGSLGTNWHARFRFILYFQLLASNYYFQWQVSRYQQIPKRVTFFLLGKRGRESIAGSYISLSQTYKREVSSLRYWPLPASGIKFSCTMKIFWGGGDLLSSSKYLAATSSLELNKEQLCYRLYTFILALAVHLHSSWIEVGDCVEHWLKEKGWVGHKVHRLSRSIFFFLSWPYAESHSAIDSQVTWYRGHTWKSLSHAKFCLVFFVFFFSP